MGGVILALIISLAWSTFVGINGLSDERVWNSFFLQYLWEFVLGMQLALYYKTNPERFKIPVYKMLIPVCTIGIVLVGITGILGGIWKSYNDIPSLLGYMGMALILYKIGIKPINGFFTYTNKISYEWYLVHILIFVCSNLLLDTFSPLPPLIRAVVAFALSYLVAITYHKILKILRLI